jgi:hypothetical protein
MAPDLLHALQPDLPGAIHLGRRLDHDPGRDLDRRRIPVARLRLYVHRALLAAAGHDLHQPPLALGIDRLDHRHPDPHRERS